ncbi:MAG TPA: RHS repeat-associated core domain-containing protein [Armatimonadota bacterium]
MRPAQLVTLTAGAGDIDKEYDDSGNPTGVEAADTLALKWFVTTNPGSDVCRDAPVQVTIGGSSTFQTCFSEPGTYMITVNVDNSSAYSTHYPDGEFNCDTECWGPRFWRVFVEADSSCPDWVCQSCTSMGPPTPNKDGASAGEPVNLATGEETYAPGPDIWAYNNSGPAASFARTFYTGAAKMPYGSPGLPPGWVHNFDYLITWKPAEVYSPGGGEVTEWANLTLVYPRGNVQTLRPILDVNGRPTGRFEHSDGVPFEVSGTPDTVIRGKWNRIVLKWTDGTKWVFEEPVQTGAWISRLKYITDTRSADPLEISHDNGIRVYRAADGRVQTVASVRGGASGDVLLMFHYENGGGALSSVEDVHAGRKVVYANDLTGQLYQVSQLGLTSDTLGSPAPQRWTYGYTSVGNAVLLHAVTVPIPRNGGLSQATIDYYPNDCLSNASCGKVSAVTDGNGFRRTIEYGAGSTRVSLQDAEGIVVKEWYQNFDAYGRNAGVSDSAGSTSVGYGYDPYRPVYVADRKGNTVQTTYDKYGHLVEKVDARGTTTTYTYVPADSVDGRLVSVREGLRAPITCSYFEPSGLPHTITTASPANPAQTVTTTFDYDDLSGIPALGNLVRVVAPGNNATAAVTTSLDYGPSSPNYGHPRAVTDNLGHQTTYTYLGGNVATVTDAALNVTSYEYNAADELTKVTHPSTVSGGSHAWREYVRLYAVGSRSYGPVKEVNDYSETGARVSHVTYTVGPEGEVRTRGGDGEPVAVDYYPTYQPSVVSDGHGNRTTYTYDAMGRLTGISYPGASGGYDTVTFLDFDPNGNPTRRIDGNGVSTTFGYNDPEDNLTSVSYSDGTPSVTMEYDPVYGRRSRMEDGSGTTVYSYDDLDNLTGVTSALTGVAGGDKVVSYAFYPNGSRSSMGTPAGTFSYTYDAAGRPTGLRNPESEDTTWTYSSIDRLQSQTSNAGFFITSYGSNGRGFLTGVYNRSLAAYVYSSFSILLRNGTGNLTSETASFDTYAPPAPPPPPQPARVQPGALALAPMAPQFSFSGTTTYSYLHSSGDPLDEALGYGPLRQEQTTRFNRYTRTYAYDTALNPTRMRSAAAASLPYNGDNQPPYQVGVNIHDGNGNPTTYGGRALLFDAENRLTQWMSSSYQYAYNGNGLRTKRKQGSVTTYYLYDGMVPVVELNAAGTVKAVNTFGANGLVSRWTPAAGTTFYEFDAHGNVANYNKADGSTTRMGFDAYGQAQAAMAGDEVFGYQAQWGGYTDSVGLVLMGYRYYDPSTGRFVTRDPIGYRGGINLYAYVGGDPVNHVDPSGLDAYVFIWPGGLGEGSHSGIGVDWPGGKVKVFEFNPDTTHKYLFQYVNDPGTVQSMTFDQNHPAFPNARHREDKDWPCRAIAIQTDPETDKRLRRWLLDHSGKNYGRFKGYTHNCSKFVADALVGSGIADFDGLIIAPQDIMDFAEHETDSNYEWPLEKGK